MKVLRKTLTKLKLLIAGSLILTACTPEDVKQDTFQAGAPILAASLDGGHPGFEMVCQTLDTLYLMSEDGSMNINKCPSPFGMINCPSNSPKWGFVIVEEGYQNGVGLLNFEVAMAPGWYGQSATWKDFSSTSLNMSSAGIPLIENDWSSAGINPLKNRFNISFNTEDMAVSYTHLTLPTICSV